MRSVVREALTRAAAKGLPGDHHFYITFKTRVAGVGMSPHLAAQYPEEMTIVIQHQFWDLTVNENQFAVTLSFSNRPERLTIPFDAVATFADPSVKFGLQFQVTPALEEAPAPKVPLVPAAAPKFTKPQAVKGVERSPDKAAAKPALKPAAKGAEKPALPGQVVALDSFRKK